MYNFAVAKEDNSAKVINISLETDKTYNLNFRVGRCILLNKDSSLLVIEKDNKPSENTEYYYFNEEYEP